MTAEKADSRRLPIAKEGAARVVGATGVLACVMCCISVPSVVAAISAMGLGFPRNDRILLPAELVSLVILLFTFARTRTRHYRNAPMLWVLTAAAIMFVGLMTPAPTGTIAALAGAIAVVSVVIWGWRLQKHCA